jgi:hypothetical protein
MEGAIMTMGEYSLSDIAAVNGENGMGNNAWWLIILFAMIWGWGGNGMGNNGNALTDIELCQANNFTQLQNSVGRLNDSIASQNMMLSNGMCNLGYQNLEQFGNLQRDLCTGFANGVAATNAVGAQMQQCCCETQRAIDGVNYNAAMNTAAINANTTEQTQKILDAICGNRMADMQNQINQLQLQNAVSGVVRYPMSTTYGAGINPFFNSGCGCCAA